MITESTDVFANTNPALGALVLWSFCTGHAKKAGEFPLHPLIFLPIPIILSDRFTRTFEGTNSSTGLFNWIERNPSLHVELPDSIRKSRSISREALVFGLRYGVLEVSAQGEVGARSAVNITRSRREKLPEGTKRSLVLAERFGSWIGGSGPLKNSLFALGIVPQ